MSFKDAKKRFAQTYLPSGDNRNQQRIIHAQKYSASLPILLREDLRENTRELAPIVKKLLAISNIKGDIYQNQFADYIKPFFNSERRFQIFTERFACGVQWVFDRFEITMNNVSFAHNIDFIDKNGNPAKHTDFTYLYLSSLDTLFINPKAINDEFENSAKGFQIMQIHKFVNESLNISYDEHQFLVGVEEAYHAYQCKIKGLDNYKVSDLDIHDPAKSTEEFYQSDDLEVEAGRVIETALKEYRAEEDMRLKRAFEGSHRKKLAYSV